MFNLLIGRYSEVVSCLKPCKVIINLLFWLCEVGETRYIKLTAEVKLVYWSILGVY